MDATELLFISVGLFTVLYYGGKIVSMAMMLFPRVWYPLPSSFFTSMGKWAVITGGSDGIGRAYALEFSKQGLNVVIISRGKEKLERTAWDIENTTGGKVKVIVADLTEEDVYPYINQELSDLDVGFLVNNVGILPGRTPRKLLQIADLEQIMHKMINCNIKAMVKMCRIVLPGMEQRRRGYILNVSSGIAKIPFPLYSLYAASKVFVERFSRGLHTEYKSKGITIQTVMPFGVSTAMTGYQKPDAVTLLPEKFVRTSLTYLRAGEQTHGSPSHTIMGWIVQAIPAWVLHTEAFQSHLSAFIKEKVGHKGY